VLRYGLQLRRILKDKPLPIAERLERPLVDEPYVGSILVTIAAIRVDYLKPVGELLGTGPGRGGPAGLPRFGARQGLPTLESGSSLGQSPVGDSP
jgi:hypothetical protein